MTAYCGKARLDAVIRSLHDLGALHILDHRKDEQADIGEPLADAPMLSDLLIKISSIANFLNMDLKKAMMGSNDFDFQYTKDKIEKLFHKVSHLQDEEKALKETKKLLDDQEQQRSFLDSLGLRPESFTGLTKVASFIAKAKSLPERADIEKISENYELASTPHRDSHSIALFFEADKAEQIRALMTRYNAVEMDIQEGLPGHDRIKSDLEANRKQLAELELKRVDVAKKVRRFLKRSEFYIKQELDKAQAPLRFATTDKAIRITGYIPVSAVEDAKKTLEKITDGNILMEFKEPGSKDNVPIRLDNPDASRPFEFFMRLYTLPSYKELDPTSIMFLTFPFFFGFMLGDMGYGVTTMILFLILKKYIPSLRDLLNVMIAASIGTIVFGALFGEVFGMEVLFGYQLPHVLSRAHQITELLILSLIVGAIHINFGLILGFINELHHGFWTAVNEKISWMILQAAALLIYFGPRPVGYALLALTVFMLYRAEGVKGIVELPSIFGNILSYSRLMALGLASVMLAMIINEKSGEMFAAGGFGIVGGILTILIGHSINIALGMLGPFLHSLRLHYVEFFGKFYKGGGLVYRPFGERRS